MRRRDFISAAIAPFIFRPVVASALAWNAQGADFYFFDERMTKASRLAYTWPAAGPIIAVQSDITPHWSNGLERIIKLYPLNLGGLTTSSFQFCLGILAAEHAFVTTRTARLDKNLYRWSMSTTPKPNCRNTTWLRYCQRA